MYGLTPPLAGLTAEEIRLIEEKADKYPSSKGANGSLPGVICPWWM